jgi:flagellar basal body-associated protein FliL|tara:strand:- start:21947 stop:22432 length:486 start_codon:yes stop_codon:yes gene_type:complete
MPKILVIVLAVVILLAGGAVTLLQQMELGPFEPEVKLTPEQIAAAAAEMARKKALEPPRFVTLEPLLIPIFQGDIVAATIQLQIQIETRKGNVSKINKQMPRLKDAYIRDLHAYVPRLLRKQKDLDIASLKRRLFVIGERTIGKGLIDGVLVQSAMNRKLR